MCINREFPVIQVGFLSLLQFLIDPLQYFSVSRLFILPSFYLGRLLTIILVVLVFLSSRRHSRSIISAFKRCLLSKPYYPFMLSTLISAFPPLLSSHSFALALRFSVIEPLSTLVYIALFSVLPSLISTKLQRMRLSSLLYPYLAIVLAVGYFDFFMALLGINFLGRSMSDRVNIGIRFHSLFHEPRDYAVASVYLISLLCAANISRLSKSRLPGLVFNFKTILLALLVVSPFLAKSASFVVGMLFFLVFIIFYFLIKLFQAGYVSKALFWIVLALLVLVLPFAFFPLEHLLDERTLEYYKSFESLVSTLKTEELMEAVLNTPLLLNQASAFLPVLQFFKDFSLTSFQSIYFTLAGYGHGYVSNLISVELLDDASDIYNSFAGFPRLLCETGFLGLFAFAYMYFSVILRPVLKPCFSLAPSVNPFSRQLYVVSSILLFCMYLAHRRQEIFLFMGFVNCFLPASEVSPVDVLPNRAS
jgi:hypothetical protein